jgi:hypothetical protein
MRGPVLIRTNSTRRASATSPTISPLELLVLELPLPVLLPLLADAGPLGCVALEDWLEVPGELLIWGWPAAASPLAKLSMTVRSW